MIAKKGIRRNLMGFWFFSRIFYGSCLWRDCPAFSLFPSSFARFLFIAYCYFYWDTQREARSTAIKRINNAGQRLVMVEKSTPNWRWNSETLKDELRTENDEVLRKPLLPCCGVNTSVSVTFQSFVLRHLMIASERNIKKLQGMKAQLG